MQGWNDGCDKNMTAAYEANLANLILDLRDEWKNPVLPISIPVSGFMGYAATGLRVNITDAQFSVGDPTKHPELNGHVASMDTRSFWRDKQYSADNHQIYHYWWNAETHALIGQAMATGMLKGM